MKRGKLDASISRRNFLLNSGALLPLSTYPLGCGDGEVSSNCAWLYDIDRPLFVATWWDVQPYDYDDVDFIAPKGADESADAKSSPQNVGDGVPDLSELAGRRLPAEELAADELENGQRRCHNDPIYLRRVPNYVYDGAKATAEDKEATMTHLEQQASGDQAFRSHLAIINLGADIDRLVADPTKVSALQPLGHFFDDPELRYLTERIPEFVRKLVTRQGQLYGVVLGLHRLNTMFYHRRTFASWGGPGVYSSSVADTSVRLRALAQVAKAQGIAKPIVVEDKYWAWSLLVVENLMVAARGTDEYSRFWQQLTPTPAEDQPLSSTEPADLDMDPLRRTLEVAVQLAPFIQRAETREEARDLLESGGAAILIQGDWEFPTFDHDRVGSAPCPGTESAFVFTGDMLAVTARDEPLNADSPEFGALKALSSPRVQVTYAEAKHATSVVKDGRDNRVTGRSPKEIFTSEEDLVPVPGLPALLPDKSFTDMGKKIRNLMSAAIHAGSEPLEVPAIRAKIDALVNYSHKEFCKVLINSGTNRRACNDADEWFDPKLHVSPH